MHELFCICPANDDASAHARRMDKGACFREVKGPVPFDDGTDAAVALSDGKVVKASVILAI